MAEQKAYNPWQHSIVQATVGTWSRYECDDFIEALFDAILNEIKRVHWNVFQHQWGPSWHADEVEDPEIPGISFARYYDDRCDCGGQFPQHTPECDVTRLHSDWNKRRLYAISDPDLDGFGRKLDFSKAREAAFTANDPRPQCTCGADAAWDEDRGCLPMCIGQRPNFQHEDVEIRWYKYPGRGMSTNKNWSSDEWRAWMDRCLATIRAFDPHDYSEESFKRKEQLREDFARRHPSVVR
jgi:hypothetical protein